MTTLEAENVKNEDDTSGGGKCANISNTPSLSPSRAPNKARLTPNSEDGTTGK